MPDRDVKRASVEAVIDASSIETGVADRDRHLRSADFLDAERYPEITFTTLRVDAEDSNRLRVVGQLSLKGVTREVTLDVERLGHAKDPRGNERVGFTAKAAIDRRTFGLTWNQALEAGGRHRGGSRQAGSRASSVRSPGPSAVDPKEKRK